MFLAIVVGVVLYPTATYAVDAFSNVAIQDPVSGVKAQVNASNALKVSDGSGSLTVDGKVTQLRTPFQQRVNASSTGGEACEDLTVPTGKRLVIESFSAEVFGNALPYVYIRTMTTTPGSTQYDRTVQLSLASAGGNAWVGNTTTLLHTGAESGSTGWSFSYSACTRATGSYADMEGFVSGWVE
jgi:hypothetical protein